LVLTLLLITACAEVPLMPPGTVLQPSPHAVDRAGALTTTCDLSWSLPIDGNFGDSTRWAPSRPPSVTDRVCFAANGAFTVTLTTDQSVNAIVVEDNTLLTLDALNQQRLAFDSLEIRRLGRAILQGCVQLSGDGTDVTGTLEARPSSACSHAHYVGTLTGTGLVDMHQAFLSAENFLNGGQLRLTGANTISFFRPVAVVGTGAVAGSGSLLLMSPDTLIWNGDALPGRNAATGLARISVDAKRLDLPTVNPASGALDFAGEMTTTLPRVVVGDVPAGVDLGLWTGGRYTLRHHTPATSRYTVRGQLTLAPVNDTLRLDVDTLVIANRLVTAGRPTVLNVYRFENRGRADLAAPLHLAATYLQTIPTFSSHENHGTIATTGAGQLEIGTYAHFPLDPSARMTGRLVLDDGDLQGSGTLDVVESRGGLIEPGTGFGGIGTIVMQSLHLSASSEVRLDVGGPAPGQSDRLRVLGTAVLDGELDVRNVNGYAGGSVVTSSRSSAG
jgi:hypothetical protein